MPFSFFRQRKAASMVEVGLILGLIAILLIGTLSSVGQNLSRLFAGTENTLENAAKGLPLNLPSSPPTTPEPEDPNPEYASCKEWSDAGHSQFISNGINPIYPNGASTPINVYCKGALTLVTAQYSNDPVRNWNEGIQTDYAPTPNSGIGFALSTSDIPSHSKTYFGQGTETPICLVGTYSTGTLLAFSDGSPVLYDDCSNAETKYYMARLATGYYATHNPDNDSRASHQYWNGTLTVELYQNQGTRSTTNDFNWAFSPRQTAPTYRQYAYQGDYLYGETVVTAPWTIWVE